MHWTCLLPGLQDLRVSALTHMPTCTILRQSALLTAAGWTTADSIPSAVELFGLDRAGKVASCSVNIAETGGRSRQAYVGTAMAFGAFAPATVLTVSDGKPWRVADIVGEGAIADLAFENVLRTFDRTSPLPCPAAIWDVLRQTAARGSGESLLLPCRLEPSVQSGGAPFVSFPQTCAWQKNRRGGGASDR